MRAIFGVQIRNIIKTLLVKHKNKNKKRFQIINKKNKGFQTKEFDIVSLSLFYV